MRWMWSNNNHRHQKQNDVPTGNRRVNEAEFPRVWRSDAANRTRSISEKHLGDLRTWVAWHKYIVHPPGPDSLYAARYLNNLGPQPLVSGSGEWSPCDLERKIIVIAPTLNEI